jgi:hypothetical protein
LLTHVPSRSPVIVAAQQVRPHTTYRHEAFFWRNSAQFLAGTVPFIVEGLAADEPVMVAVVDSQTQLIREALGPDADRVHFVDMAELGRNPAKIIPAWREFLDAESSVGRPVRGIGEPIWPGRRPEEILESQFHEALLNIAVEPDTPFWLLCPYDAERLPPSVIEEAHRSHPAIRDADGYRGSITYAGRTHIDTIFASDLPELSGTADEMTFSEGLRGVPLFVAVRAHAAGVPADEAAALAVAVQNLAMSSLQRGATQGTIRVRNEEHAVICEIQDEIRVDDPLAGRKAVPREQRNGLWSANQVCDLVQFRSTTAGTTVRIYHWI